MYEYHASQNKDPLQRKEGNYDIWRQTDTFYKGSGTCSFDDLSKHLLLYLLSCFLTV